MIQSLQVRALSRALCTSIIHALRSAKIDQLPTMYVLKRFRKDCKRESVFSPEGILLEERANSPVNPMLQKLISETSNRIESLFVQAKNSPDAMQILRDGVFALGDRITDMIPAKELSRIEEFEDFLGCPVPMQVEIHPPLISAQREGSNESRDMLTRGGNKIRMSKKRRMCYSHEGAAHARRSDCMIVELVPRKQTTNELGSSFHS